MFTCEIGGEFRGFGRRADFIGRDIAFHVLNEFRLIENIVGIISVVVNIVLRNRIDLYAASGQFESNRFNEAILRAARRAVRRVIRDAF